jgi:RNA polymerase-binding transcription factor DksA
LIRLRDHLTGQRQNRNVNAEAERGANGEHMADAATDSYDRDWELALASSDQGVLYEIEQALNRMASGTYGLCEVTGEPIEASRLKALPWTRFSAAAQADLEARGAVNHIQLGHVGSYIGSASDSESSDEDDAEEPERLAA